MRLRCSARGGSSSRGRRRKSSSSSSPGRRLHRLLGGGDGSSSHNRQPHGDGNRPVQFGRAILYDPAAADLYAYSYDDYYCHDRHGRRDRRSRGAYRDDDDDDDDEDEVDDDYDDEYDHGGIGGGGGGSRSRYDPDSTKEPELYSLVRRGSQCDWDAVSARLDRIREGVDYLRQLRDVVVSGRDAVYETNRRRTLPPFPNGGIGVGSGSGSGSALPSSPNDRFEGGPRWQQQQQQQQESFTGIVVGRGRPLNRRLILRDLRDLSWRHPYSGVTALHVAVCWHPPQAVLKAMVELALDAVEFLCPRPDRRTNPLWVRSRHGLTPLHLACSNIDEEHVARTLMESCVPALPALGRVEAGVLRAAAATGWMRKGPVAGKRTGAAGNDRPSSSYQKCCCYSSSLLQTKEKGSTPLHCAAQSGASFDIIRLLVESQPYAVLVRDAEGLTPLDVLCRGHERFLDRILVLIRVQRDVRRATKRRKREKDRGFGGVHAFNHAAFSREDQDHYHDDDDDDDDDDDEDGSFMDITTDLPPKLNHAVGPPAHDDPGLESYRRSFLREPLKEFWSKSTLLLRTMAALLDDSDDDMGKEWLDATAAVGGGGQRQEEARLRGRYSTNSSILRAMAVVAPQRGGRIPLALLHLIAASVPRQATMKLSADLQQAAGSRDLGLALHVAIRASFGSYGLSNAFPFPEEKKAGEGEGGGDGDGGGGVDATEPSSESSLAEGFHSHSHPSSSLSQADHLHSSDGWHLRSGGGVAYVAVRRFEHEAAGSAGAGAGAASDPTALTTTMQQQPTSPSSSSSTSQLATPVDVVETLLDLYPGATRVVDGKGKTPLAAAMESYSNCSSFVTRRAGLLRHGDGIVRAILKREPWCLEGLRLPDELIGRALAKFARSGGEGGDYGGGGSSCFRRRHSTSPRGGGGSGGAFSISIEGGGDLNTVFDILRSKPDIVKGGGQVVLLGTD